MRHRNFRYFFFGQFISLIGTWMQSLAQQWLVYTLTNHSAFQLGLVSTFQYLPVLALSLHAGVIVDRLPKRRLIVATQIGFGVLATVLGVLALTGQVQIWEVYIIAALFGVVNAFDVPARQAFMVEMVGRDDLLNGIALNSSIFNASRIFGPAIAALLIAQVGTAVCFLINAASFIPVIGGLLLMRIGAVPRARIAGRPLQQIAEGLRYIRQHERLWLVFAQVSVVSIFGIPMYVTLLPLFATNVLHSSVNALGILSSFLGVGALIGAIVLAYLPPGPARARLLLSAAVAFSVLLAAFAASRSLTLSSLAMVGLGLSIVSVNSSGNAIIQEATPDRLRGRVMSVWGFVLIGLTPVGSLIAGTLAQQFGAQTAVMVGAAICGVAAVAVNIRARRRHALTDPPDAPRVLESVPDLPAAGAIEFVGARQEE